MGHTFGQIYQSIFKAWEAQRAAGGVTEKRLLYVGGESAGAYLAQRVATDGGAWKARVNASLVAGVPILNPAAVNPTAKSEALQTHYLVNGCDDLTELGAAMKGWFNAMPGTAKRVSVHKPFKTAAGAGHGDWNILYTDWMGNAASWYVLGAGSYGRPRSRACTDPTLVPRIKN